MPHSSLPTSLKTPRGRRVKRGIVAGYIHDISPRHRPAARLSSTPVSTPAPSTPLLLTEPAVAAEPQRV